MGSPPIARTALGQARSEENEIDAKFLHTAFMTDPSPSKRRSSEYKTDAVQADANRRNPQEKMTGRSTSANIEESRKREVNASDFLAESRHIRPKAENGKRLARLDVDRLLARAAELPRRSCAIPRADPVRGQSGPDRDQPSHRGHLAVGMPLTLAIVIGRIYRFPPRTQSEAQYLSNDWGTLVLRVTSIACLLIGGAIALISAKPEPRPSPKGKRRVRSKRRRR